MKNSSIADLWKVETLGIMDPVLTKSKEEIEKNTVVHFMNPVERREKERYIVQVPWIEANEIVQDNRSVAEQRYIQTSQTMKEEGKYTAYEAVFKEWFDEEVIEKKSKEEIRNLSSREDWKHLQGTCNPADLPSRSCSVQGVLKSR
ncbi:hypothetical protein TNCT_272951 [Trichonephila clavata]|uniref:Uncharacterized protein n=1 Tax=Trichonephila clavata TaxID=2740835 RepID=A0A8X6FS24_TRICU|nr:hypothetical protein TNCT_272951 [Trichonephila clavata]